ncbi:MAG TPA: hypothetical protein VGR14_22400 [Verrucomicrobiae bacterium]|nr:hypothetical protein [Verrucomicrobiae bacterium]
MNIGRGALKVHQGGDIGIYVFPCGEVPEKDVIKKMGLEWLECVFIGTRPIF